MVGSLTEQAVGDWLFYKVVSQDVCLVASDGVEKIMVSVLCEGSEGWRQHQGISLAPNYNDSMKRRRSLAIVDEGLARRPRMRSQTGGLGPSIKYVALFLANVYPPLPCHTSSHISDPPPDF